MAHVDDKSDTYETLARQAFDASERAERAGRQAHAAGRSAADSLDKSANSQDRTAKAFETAAEVDGHRGAEFREHATHHRNYAKQDREMAHRLRRMFTGDSTH